MFNRYYWYGVFGGALALCAAYVVVTHNLPSFVYGMLGGVIGYFLGRLLLTIGGR